MNLFVWVFDWVGLDTVPGKILDLRQQNSGTSLLSGFVHKQSLFVDDKLGKPGAGIMEADHRQVKIVFTVQLSSHHRHSTNRVS